MDRINFGNVMLGLVGMSMPPDPARFRRCVALAFMLFLFLGCFFFDEFVRRAFPISKLLLSPMLPQLRGWNDESRRRPALGGMVGMWGLRMLPRFAAMSPMRCAWVVLRVVPRSVACGSVRCNLPSDLDAVTNSISAGQVVARAGGGVCERCGASRVQHRRQGTLDRAQRRVRQEECHGDGARWLSHPQPGRQFGDSAKASIPPHPGLPLPSRPNSAHQHEHQGAPLLAEVKAVWLPWVETV